MKVVHVITIIWASLLSACESKESTSPKLADSEAIHSLANFHTGVAVAYSQLTGNTVWFNPFGIDYYFKQEDYPILYDDNYEPKSMYAALKEALSK